MRAMRWLVLIFLAATVVFGLFTVVNAQSSDSVYIAETGHWIWGEFLRKYNSVPDPLLYYGYPITDDFTDPVTNQRVQYFQKARFNLVDKSNGHAVQLAPVGELLLVEGVPLADIPQEGPNCRAFETGFSVCYAFLQFFDAQDGATHFGNPVSGVEVVDGRYVQYFQYARMEWWPDRPSGTRVALTDLGRIYFDAVIGNSDLLKSSPPANIAANLTNPRAKVFSLHSLLGVGEQQTVYVIVQDQYLRPIEYAQVGVTLVFPDGSKEFYRLPETNEYGVSQFSFLAPDFPVRSTVSILAEVSIRGEFTEGRSWFRLWW